MVIELNNSAFNNAGFGVAGFNSTLVDRNTGALKEYNTFSVGRYHTLVIKEDGTLWVTGSNYQGQIGLGTSNGKDLFQQIDASKWKCVSAGDFYSLAIKDDGTLWVTGLNTGGRLGLGIEDETFKATTFTQVGTDTDWKSVDTGISHTTAIKTDGTLWVTGKNNYGQLGLNDTVNRNVFTQVGTDGWKSVSNGRESTAAIKEDGTLWVTGLNNLGSYGIIGLGQTASVNNFTQVGTSRWKSISISDAYTMAIKENGTLWGTGFNYYGQLGLGDNANREIFTQIGTSDNWKYVSASEQHTMAIKEDSTLWAVGDSLYGKLCLGDVDDTNIFTQVGTDADWIFVTTGIANTFAIKADRVFYVCGDNGFGQYGIAGSFYSRTLITVDFKVFTDFEVLSDKFIFNTNIGITTTNEAIKYSEMSNETSISVSASNISEKFKFLEMSNEVSISVSTVNEKIQFAEMIAETSIIVSTTIEMIGKSNTIFSNYVDLNVFTSNTMIVARSNSPPVKTPIIRRVSPNNMTSATAPAPYVVTRSAEFSTLVAAWRAFNDDVSNDFGWRLPSPTGWIAIDLSAKKTVTKYSLKYNGTMYAADRVPKDFSLMGSHDGTTWVTLDTRVNNTAVTVDVVNTFEFANAVAYRHYKLNVTANNLGTTTYIGRIELFESAEFDRVYIEDVNADFSTGTLTNVTAKNDSLQLSTEFVDLPLYKTKTMQISASNGNNIKYGMSFNLPTGSLPQKVTKLGHFGNVNGNKTLELWDVNVTSAPIASVIVNYVVGGSNWQYANLTIPVTLQPNKTYMLAMYSNNPNELSWSVKPTTTHLKPPFTYDNWKYKTGTTGIPTTSSITATGLVDMVIEETAYVASGNRISSPISLVKPESSMILWDATVPTNTILTVQTSVNNGSTWDNVNSGETIPNLTNATSLLVKESFTTSNTKISPILNKLEVGVNSAEAGTQIFETHEKKSNIKITTSNESHGYNGHKLMVMEQESTIILSTTTDRLVKSSKEAMSNIVIDSTSFKKVLSEKVNTSSINIDTSIDTSRIVSQEMISDINFESSIDSIKKVSFENTSNIEIDSTIQVIKDVSYSATSTFNINSDIEVVKFVTQSNDVNLSIDTEISSQVSVVKDSDINLSVSQVVRPTSVATSSIVFTTQNEIVDLNIVIFTNESSFQINTEKSRIVKNTSSTGLVFSTQASKIANVSMQNVSNILISTNSLRNASLVNASVIELDTTKSCEFTFGVGVSYAVNDILETEIDTKSVVQVLMEDEIDAKYASSIFYENAINEEYAISVDYEENIENKHSIFNDLESDINVPYAIFKPYVNELNTLYATHIFTEEAFDFDYSVFKELEQTIDENYSIYNHLDIEVENDFNISIIDEQEFDVKHSIYKMLVEDLTVNHVVSMVLDSTIDNNFAINSISEVDINTIIPIATVVEISDLNGKYVINISNEDDFEVSHVVYGVTDRDILIVTTSSKATEITAISNNKSIVIVTNSSRGQMI